MQRKKVVFLGSKPIGYNCFSHLLSVQDTLGIEVTALLTHSRKEFGNAHDLNTLAAGHNVRIVETVDDIPACDILYSVQYHEILQPEHIKRAAQIAVNLHMAPLPEYRGSNQFSYAIIDGKKEFGTSIHKIDAEIDSGDILFEKRFPIPADCWVNELYELTYQASVDLFRETLADIVKGKYNPVPQKSLIPKNGTSLHYRKEINTLKHIDLEWNSEKIKRHIRATSMPGFEPPYFFLDGKKVYFSQTPS